MSTGAGNRITGVNTVQTIAEEIVDRVWREIMSMDYAGVQELIKKLSEEQPTILAYLMAVDSDKLNRDEREILVLTGVTIWKMMSSGPVELKTVTDLTIDSIEGNNIKMAEYFMGEPADTFDKTVQLAFERYNQPHVLEYALESIMDDEEETIREKNKGLMFLDLKTIIDCLDQ